MALVEGQVTPDPGSVEGQNTGTGKDAEYGAPPYMTGSERQPADGDVEGQINDERPRPVVRPYPDLNPLGDSKPSDVGPAVRHVSARTGVSRGSMAAG